MADASRQINKSTENLPDFSITSVSVRRLVKKLKASVFQTRKRKKRRPSFDFRLEFDFRKTAQRVEKPVIEAFWLKAGIRR